MAPWWGHRATCLPNRRAGCPVDARADVFALGRILESMLTGQDEPDAGGPARVPRPISSILAKALDPEPDRRYPGARELGDDIGRYLSGLRVLAHHEGPFEVMGRLAVKYKTPLALILAYVLDAGASPLLEGAVKERAPALKREVSAPTEEE